MVNKVGESFDFENIDFKHDLHFPLEVFYFIGFHREVHNLKDNLFAHYLSIWPSHNCCLMDHSIGALSDLTANFAY